MAKAKSKVEIKCETKHALPLSGIAPFQGELKQLSDKNYRKLRYQIEKHGFCVPFFVWKSGDRNYILDGHQRESVLERMLSDGVELPEAFPVVYVQADDVNDAKRKLLAINSQYGEMTSQGLHDFIADTDIDFVELDGFEFAQIDMGELADVMDESNKEIGEVTVSDEILIIITCNDEAQQVELLERFEEEGLTCKAII